MSDMSDVQDDQKTTADKFDAFTAASLMFPTMLDDTLKNNLREFSNTMKCEKLTYGVTHYQVSWFVPDENLLKYVHYIKKLMNSSVCTYSDMYEHSGRKSFVTLYSDEKRSKIYIEPNNIILLLFHTNDLVKFKGLEIYVERE